MGSVLGSLAELGYGIAYRVLDAQFFGVPQQRKRVFIVGHLGAPWGAPAQVLLEPESGGGDSSAGGQAWPDVAGTLMAGANATGGTRPPGTQVDTVNTLVVAPTVTAKWAKGTGGPAGDETQNLVVTPEASTHTHRRGDVAGRREAGLPDRRRISSRGAPHHREVVSAMTTSYCGGVGGPDDNAAQAGYLIVDYAPDVAATLTVVRRLTELECERLQGYPDQYTDGQSGSARYRQLGNSVAVPNVEWVARRLVAVDRAVAESLGVTA